MSEHSFGEAKKPISIRLYDAEAYDRTTRPASLRGLYSEFTEGFEQYVATLAETDQTAAELHAALSRMPAEHSIGTTVSVVSQVDWTQAERITDVPALFSALNDLNSVLNSPPTQFAIEAYEFNSEHGHARSDAPLAQFTRWLFQDPTLELQHGFYWERYIQQELAPKYVTEKHVERPASVTTLLTYGQEAAHKGYLSALRGEDTIEIGILQLIGEAISRLDILEQGDARYDYTLREQVAAKAVGLFEDPEKLLQYLLTLIEPEDFNANSLTGALYKPVTIADPDGTVHLNDIQRFDSFWFMPISAEDDVAGNERGFPTTPLVIRHNYGNRILPPGEERITNYSDPSYFTPEGFKVYWGDLAVKDLAKVRGTYYCLSQADSFHQVPKWAITLSDFVHSDPNRPAHSTLNAEFGEFMLPENPIYFNPLYVRASAIGAIVDGVFIKNHRYAHTRFKITS